MVLCDAAFPRACSPSSRIAVPSQPNPGWKPPACFLYRSCHLHEPGEAVPKELLEILECDWEANNTAGVGFGIGDFPELKIVILCSTPPSFTILPKKRSTSTSAVQGLRMFWLKIFRGSKRTSLWTWQPDWRDLLIFMSLSLLA